MIAASKHVALSRVEGHSDMLEPGRVGTLHLGGILPGGVLIASTDLHRSVGLSPQNWSIL